MMTGTGAKYLIETTHPSNGHSDGHRMSSAEARNAAANQEHPLRIFLRWLTPNFVRRSMDQRVADRHLKRSIRRLSQLSPHLLDDVGMADTPSQQGTGRFTGRPSDNIKHLPLSKAARESRVATDVPKLAAE
jgi:uncharacterized protein YjiS (DUF1127 family)